MRLRERIVAAIDGILSGRGKSARAWTDEDSLMQAMDLDSLDLAVLVVTLEEELGVDPFRDGRAAVQTLGQLTAVYESALGTRA